MTGGVNAVKTDRKKRVISNTYGNGKANSNNHVKQQAKNNLAANVAKELYSKGRDDV